MRKNLLVRSIAAVSGVAMLAALGACGNNEPASGSSNAAGKSASSAEKISGEFQGAGASSQQAAVEAWIASYQSQNPDAKIWFATTKAKYVYTDVQFGPDDYIMFGKESAGIPEEILVEHEENCIRIPMLPQIRSLNLSNSVSIVLYEALRQQQFSQMQLAGELHRLHWKE